MLLVFCYISMYFFQGEIGRRSGGDNVLEREGHAVSAGFALGLVALGMNAKKKKKADIGQWFSVSLSNQDMLLEGRGEDALGFIETCVNRLFLYLGGNVHSVRYGINKLPHLLFTPMLRTSDLMFSYKFEIVPFWSSVVWQFETTL